MFPDGSGILVHAAGGGRSDLGGMTAEAGWAWVRRGLREPCT